MKIPKTLKIGGLKIKVSVVDKLENSATGEYQENTSEIRLLNGMPPPITQVTLIHEILHVLCLNWAEEHVEMTAQALYQVLSENNLTFDGKEIT